MAYWVFFVAGQTQKHNAADPRAEPKMHVLDP